MSKLQSETSRDVILNFSGTATLAYLNGYVYLRIECEFWSCYVKMNVRDETRHGT